MVNKMNCPKCGFTIKNNSKFCPKCGFNLNNQIYINDKNKDLSNLLIKHKNKIIPCILVLIIIVYLILYQFSYFGIIIDYRSITEIKGITKTLKTINIPNTIVETTLMKSSLKDCYNVETINIPSSVILDRYQNVFESCTNLKAINVSKYNKRLFSEDGILYSNYYKEIRNRISIVKYPQNKTDYSFNIPYNVDVIGDFAFKDCKYLEEIDIPDNVTYIGDYAFQGCKKLKSIRLPKNLKLDEGYYSEGQFKNCDNLEYIEAPYGLNLRRMDIPRGCWIIRY